MAGLAVRSTTREDADDAAMPALAVDDEQPVRNQFVVAGKALLDYAQRGSLGIAPLAIQPFELGGKFSSAVRVAGREELDHLRGHVHAPGGVDTRSKTEGHIEAGKLLG